MGGGGLECECGDRECELSVSVSGNLSVSTGGAFSEPGSVRVRGASVDGVDDNNEEKESG